MCGKCRQHGFEVKYKNHPSSCPFAECPCSKCLYVDNYRKRIRETIRRLKIQKVLKNKALKAAEARNNNIMCLNLPSTSTTISVNPQALSSTNYLQNYSNPATVLSQHSFSTTPNTQLANDSLSSSPSGSCGTVTPIMNVSPYSSDSNNLARQLNSNVNLLPTGQNIAFLKPNNQLCIVPLFLCDLQ
ncbi:unnamed protein product [Bursaphelenchus okinawaensis]|uniref:DM domain-containing protein n=1 Tax=Bursaphelenchus okinawaensis TaxID=465554 RepID=A0A811L1U9_9BILA|nr:unnamed protein product [Bursaphelenchus okinawaensis]CAG9115318.1 unnamed protein product [Bursaphelenchus okinawaensis]